jgi:hypothetical protein
MALPANPQSPSSPFQSSSDWLAEHTQRSHRNTNALHGIKRRADEQDEADQQQAIAGVKKLRIAPARTARSVGQLPDSDGQVQSVTLPTHHYSTFTPTHDHHSAAVPGQLHPTSIHKHGEQLLPDDIACDTPPPQTLPSNHEDFMPVDDNPHRIFIDDLDAAIAEIEAEERAAAEKQQERAFFLPDDVDKEISGVPEQVLKSSYGTSDPTPSQALVLYRDPLSISVPAEEDAVRRAVHDARARIRERSSRPESTAISTSHGDLVSCDEDFGYPLGRQAPSWQSEHPSDHTMQWETDAMDLE